jgi:hypothetical protein
MILVGGLPAFAQKPTFDLQGIVSDAQKAVLPGATVTIRNVSTGLTRAVTTDAGGRYIASGFPPEGIYEIKVELPGFATEVLKGLEFNAGQHATFNVSLKLSSVQETVDVKAEAPLIQTSTSEVSQTITQKNLETLPVKERNYFRMMMLNSNVAVPYAGTNAAYAGGGDVWDVGTYVDGVDNFSKWLTLQRGPQQGSSGYALETVKDVQLITNPFSAEYGGHKFGVISTITKSGTNDFHGAAFVTIRPGALDAIPPLATQKTPFNEQLWGGVLGGPIQTDKLFFFFSYEQRREHQGNTVTSPEDSGATVESPSSERQFHGRLDTNLTNNQTLAVRVNSVRWSQVNESGGLYLPGTGFNWQNNVDTVHIQHTTVVSSTFLNELRAQYSRYYDLRTSESSLPVIDRVGYAYEGGNEMGSGFGVTPENTTDIADTVSLWRGAHSIKFGANMTYESLTQHYGILDNGEYMFFGPPSIAPEPSLFIQILAIDPSEKVLHPESLMAGGFLQDDWHVRKGLTLNLGLRYSVEKIMNTPGYDAPTDMNEWDPRLGFAWDPTGSGKWALRGGAGRFTQTQLMYTIVQGGLLGPDGLVTLVLPYGSPGSPTYPNVLPAIQPGTALPPRNIDEISNDLKPEYAYQATAGFQRMLGARSAVSVDVTWTRGYHQAYLDVNAPATNPPGNIRTIAEADATRPITPTVDGFRQIAELGNWGRSWYKGVQFAYNNRGEVLNWTVNYTLSKSEDMLNHWNVPEDSNNPLGDKGPTGTDQRHNVVGYATWALPGKSPIIHGWRLSAVGQAHSGQPYNITYGDDRNGTGNADARPGGRNTGRGAAYKNVDFTLARAFRLGKPQLELRLDMFNAFNFTNYVAGGYIGTLNSPNFGQPTGGEFGVFPGRQFQFGGTVRF